MPKIRRQKPRTTRKSNLKEGSNQMESYQSLETNKGYRRQREKKLWAHQKIQKYQMYFYFNQLVEPAYSTDREQNA